MGIIIAVIVFSIIIIIHELGHFLFAKWNGIEVFEFSLGMGPKLWKKKIGDTEYCLKLFPIGGSCMMGEDGDVETSAADNADGTVDGMEEHNTKQTTTLRGNFNEKSVWARFAVIAGGPLFNFILAFVGAVTLSLWVGYDPAILSSVGTDTPAEAAGLQAGDRILEMNNANINLSSEISSFMFFNGGDEIEVKYEREGEKYTTTLQPILNEQQSYVMGVTLSPYVKGNLLDAVRYGAYNVKHQIVTVFNSLKMMVTGRASTDDIMGPVGIVDVMGDTYEQSVQYGWDVVFLNFLNLVVLLSANLGVMNLLPIPALDGGRLVFLAIEGIRGKRIPPEKEGLVHTIGFVALLGLMVFVLFNDIMRIF